MAARWFHFFPVVMSFCIGMAAAGDAKKAPEAKKKPPAPPRCATMDYGPFISCTCGAGGDNIAIKGVIVHLNKEKQANICFDTELLRISAGWTDGYIDWKGPAFDTGHASGPNAKGTIKFQTKRNPGWALDGGFTDPRKDKDGPLPADWARYKGLYLNGDKVIFSYTVGNCKVLESAGAAAYDSTTAFTRNLTLGPSDKPLTMLVCEADGALTSTKKEGGVQLAVLGSDKTQTVVGAAGLPNGAEWQVAGGRVQIKLPALGAPASFKLATVTLPAGDAVKCETLLSGAPENLEPLTKGGPARWTEKIEVKGALGAGDAPYVVDTLTIPEQNPWNSWMRLGGMDFFADGKSAAVTTWSGDVWVVSGIDDKLEKLTWKRFATGLFQPLGLKIVDDKVYTLGRDQITRLHDLNNDGEADFYECFNNDCCVTTGFHEFTFDLHTDPQGNFYYSKGSPVNPGGRGFQRISAHNGCVMKVSKDGSKAEVFATGFRAPNGIGVGPNGEVTTGDNQGTWTPLCPLNLVRPGGFYGVIEAAQAPQKPAKRDPPICWFPMSVDNSGGGQVWVTSDKWGPFKGQMLHLSYGKCSLFKVMYETVGGVHQGGVVRFPLSFASGIMRARFNPADGQLYVAGLKGWQTSAAADGCFQRVRYKDLPVSMPTALHVTKTGVDVTFTCALDAAAADAANYSVEAFCVGYTDQYGCDEYSPSDFLEKGWVPNDYTPRNSNDLKAKNIKKAHDPWPVKSAKISADGKTVSLEIPDIKPVTNMIIKYRIKAADGTALKQEIFNTINIMP